MRVPTLSKHGKPKVQLGTGVPQVFLWSITRAAPLGFQPQDKLFARSNFVVAHPEQRSSVAVRTWGAKPLLRAKRQGTGKIDIQFKDGE